MITVPAADGTPLHVWEAGTADGPVLLLLHGLGQSGRSWRPLWESPLADRFRLVCPDLRGHGRSGVPADPSGLVDQAAWGSDGPAVLDALGVDRAVVVGWSYGGVVALDTLTVAPDRVRGLVLVGAPPGAGVPDARAWFDPGFLALAPGLTSSDAATYVAAQRGLVERCVSEELPVDVAAAQLGEAVLTDPATIVGVLGRRVDSRPVLAASDVPLLVVTGTADRVITGAAADAVVAVRPDAQVRRYPTGHTPFAEDTVAFARDLAEFVDALG